jgi:hypothetical protein
MRKYLILAHSEVTANALNSWLEIIADLSLPKGHNGRIVWEDSNAGAGTISAYELLVRRIVDAVKIEDGSVPMNEAVVLVDSIEPANLSAIYEGYSWENLLALLILSFPEFHWAFGLLESPGAFPDIHTLETLWTKCQRNPLLDPTGLREWVRSQTNEALKQLGDDLKLPERMKLAAAIDEEGSYACLNAYTAYRFGCRADMVTTWGVMQEIFGDDAPNHSYWLLLEDMSLNFADKPNNKHLLRLDKYYETDTNEKTGNRVTAVLKLVLRGAVKLGRRIVRRPGQKPDSVSPDRELQGREHWCPKLDSKAVEDGIPIERSAYRVLVTTGQARDKTTLKANQKYLRAKVEGEGTWVFKPSKGIFGLWRDAKLLSDPLFRKVRNETGFEWPPDLASTNHSKGSYKGHGSPGKLMLVADTLIRRSRGLLVTADSVEDAIQGAVLATDALELTGGRTPTFAVDALTLKHHFEVLAECQFSGVAHQIHTKWRLKDIDAETESLSRWFRRKGISQAGLNARMHVLNTLIRVFRDHNKFDEELQCMIEVRSIHNSLWLKQRPWRFLCMPLVRYFELLMKSFSWFGLCLLGWVALFGWLFKTSANYPTYWYGLFDSVSSIFAISGPTSHYLSPASFPIPSWYAVFVCGAIITGVAHLGVFVSHLYSIVSRK